MTPTNRLRFLERVVPVDDEIARTERVLQQWWEDRSTDVHWVDGNPGEWRDVPMEIEE